MGILRPWFEELVNIKRKTSSSRLVSPKRPSAWRFELRSCDAQPHGHVMRPTYDVTMEAWSAAQWHQPWRSLVWTRCCQEHNFRRNCCLWMDGFSLSLAAIGQQWIFAGDRATKVLAKTTCKKSHDASGVAKWAPRGLSFGTNEIERWSFSSWFASQQWNCDTNHFVMTNCDA